uniref:Uncharacterized protein n=1 Tax=Cyclopterus lumpus TaxID=8103 RepID=A0A8C2ZQF5_CYCLU
MANAHRTNVLVTSCLKTPVDPRTRAPLASYERERVLPHAATCHRDHRDHRHRDEEVPGKEARNIVCFFFTSLVILILLAREHIYIL